MKEINKMTYVDAIMIAEGEKKSTMSEHIAAWQFLIDTGICWELQGKYGRQAHNLILEGICKLPYGKVLPVSIEKPKDVSSKDDGFCEACECNPCDSGYGNY